MNALHIESKKRRKNVARQLHPMGHLDTSVRCTHNSPFKLIAAHLSLVYQIFSFPLFIRFSFFPCIWDFYLSLLYQIFTFPLYTRDLRHNWGLDPVDLLLLSILMNIRLIYLMKVKDEIDLEIHEIIIANTLDSDSSTVLSPTLKSCRLRSK